MRIAIAGAHGQIARHLTRRLATRGEQVIGLIRNPEHADELRADGAEPVVCDLEREATIRIAEAIGGCEAVVFAAGAGPNSGAERKLTVDRDSAIKLLEAAEATGAGRYLILSAVGAESPPEGDEVFAVYLRAKAQADDAVRQSGLDWTILRPGRLTNDRGTGHVQVEAEPFRGEIAREDVAEVLDVTLRDRLGSRRILYVNGGPVKIEQALRALEPR